MALWRIGFSKASKNDARIEYLLYYVIAIAHGKKLKGGKLMEDLKNAIILHGWYGNAYDIEIFQVKFISLYYSTRT